MAFAKCLLMTYGHHPRDVEEMPWRDVDQFLAVAPALEARRSPFGGNR